MPIKLNVCIACTINDDNFDSRSASIRLEVELDPAVVMETDKLQEGFRRSFEVIRQALTDELDASRPDATLERLAESLPAPP